MSPPPGVLHEKTADRDEPLIASNILITRPNPNGIARSRAHSGTFCSKLLLEHSYCSSDVGSVAGHLEIERKFLVKRLPAGWKRRPSSPNVQGYFPIADKDLEIRLRRKGSEHFITIKGGRGHQRLEEEIKIPKPMFRALWPLTGAARISKRRYKIPCDGKTIEMDVY